MLTLLPVLWATLGREVALPQRTPVATVAAT